MSKARGILLVSAGLAALGIAGAMITDGEVDWVQKFEAFRSGDRGASLAVSVQPVAPHSEPVAPLEVVDPAPQTVVVTLPAPTAPGASPQRKDVGDHVSLAQSLQRELQRVGCYSGSLDGVWTPLSQEAMKAFLKRVNAQLPVDQPDYVLLALVRGRQSLVCRKACPPGQTLTAEEACVAAKVAPERSPAALNPPAIAVNPAPAQPDMRAVVAGPKGGAIAPAPPTANGTAPPSSAPGVASPPSPSKQKAAAMKTDPDAFRPADLYRRLLQSSR